MWTGGFWKLSVNRTENPAWKWARLPTGEPPQWHHDFNSQKSFPFSSRNLSFKQKPVCRSLPEIETKLQTYQEQFTPEPLASLWWWGDCPLADRGVVTCSSASIWKRSGFHLSTCRSFVSNASGLRCDTDFFLGGWVEILDDFSEDTKPLGISECVSLLMKSSWDEFLKSSGSCTGYLWGYFG